MTRYYLFAYLIEDFETYSLEESCVELQDSDKNGGLWVPKPKSFFLKSLGKEVSINWDSTGEYNYYSCEFQYGDEAFKEYVEQLMQPLMKQTPIMNGVQRIPYVISKALN